MTTPSRSQPRRPLRKECPDQSDLEPCFGRPFPFHLDPLLVVVEVGNDEIDHVLRYLLVVDDELDPLLAAPALDLVLPELRVEPECEVRFRPGIETNLVIRPARFVPRRMVVKLPAERARAEGSVAPEIGAAERRG